MKYLLGLSLIVGMALASHRQTQTWQSEEVLWSRAARISPEMPRPRINLGLVYQRANRMTEAVREFQMALYLTKDSRRLAEHQKISKLSAENNLALMKLVQGDFMEGLRMSTEVLFETPNYRNAMINRGAAELALGDCRSARLDYQFAGIEELPRCN